MFIVIITFLTITMSAPAGTGGGGVLVPMYIIVGQFSPHGAIPLSKATIFGGAIANNFFNIRRRHPRADRPVIDYHTVVLLEPILLLGTVIGVFTNALSPGWLITIMLVGTLTFVTYRTYQKGQAAYRTETAEARMVMPEPFTTTDSAPDERRALMPGAGGADGEVSAPPPPCFLLRLDGTLVARCCACSPCLGSASPAGCLGASQF